MKRYSSANLLSEELSFIKDNDFLSKILYKITKTSTITLTIEVPVNLYLRTEVFCDDVMELSEMIFDQGDLIYLLFNDFMLFAKKNPNPIAIFKLLTSLERESGKDAILEQQEGNLFKLTHQQKQQQMKILEFKFRRKHVLRGEILLADLEEVQPKHGFTLEKVLSLLYCDFVDKFRKGNNSEVINTIVSSLTDES